MRRAPLLSALAVLFACAPATVADQAQPTLRWSANLEARPGAPSAVTANATAVRTAGATTVQVEATGAQPNARHPWHVHHGSCETGGQIVGDPGRYPPLEVGAQGRGTATALIEVELAPGQPYHINVHRAADDLRTIIACGDLREAGPR